MSPNDPAGTPQRFAARVGVQSFWSLLAFQALLVALAAIWLYNLNPVSYPAPAPAGGDLAVVHDAIRARLQGFIHDPVIVIGGQEAVHESNLRGFRLNGTIYYYYLERADARNYDPLSRGAVSADEVNIVLRDQGGPYPMVIYTLHGK
jgi:hypothetical protein